MDVGNLRFETRKASIRNPEDTRWLIDVTRISDGHWLTPQMWFDHEPTAEQINDAAQLWIHEHTISIADEPPKTHCVACGKELESEYDTNYQFDNALWIAFHGGYGMFTDEMSTETKILKGADHEAVICHECAHKLCETVPWIGKLIEPHRSHAHRTDLIPGLMAEGHQGWDLDRHYKEGDEDAAGSVGSG